MVAVYFEEAETSLAIGKTLVSSAECGDGKTGPGIEILHVLGDGIWSLAYGTRNAQVAGAKKKK